MVVIVIHNAILHYGISQPMSSVTPVEALSSKKPIKMEQRKNSALMKHVQLDRLKKRERKRPMMQ